MTHLVALAPCRSCLKGELEIRRRREPDPGSQLNLLLTLGANGVHQYLKDRIVPAKSE